jgi:hypothetical protein
LHRTHAVNMFLNHDQFPPAEIAKVASAKAMFKNFKSSEVQKKL